MSRIGKMPVAIPDKVKIDVKDGMLEANGPLGKMIQKLPVGTRARVDGNNVIVEIEATEAENSGALHGLARALVANAVTGVSKGFKKDLEIVGLGYRAQVAGDKLTLSLGFAVPVQFKIPAGLKVTVDPKQTLLSISGVSAYLVGETAAQIRRLRKPEPYKGSGIKYVGEHIIRKAGKAAAGAVGGGAKK